MLTATITITAPDHESLVECIDLVTASVAAGHTSYEDAAEGDSRIRYALTNSDDASEVVSVAVDYDVVEAGPEARFQRRARAAVERRATAARGLDALGGVRPHRAACNTDALL